MDGRHDRAWYARALRNQGVALDPEGKNAHEQQSRGLTILVCGEALVDVFVGERTEAGWALDARLGGSAFNVAIGLARLERPVALLTGVSGDVFGVRIAEALAENGVDTRALKRTDAPTTLALVSTRADGSPDFAFRGEGAADRLVTEADCPDPAGYEALVFGCFSILTEPTGDSFLTLARAASGRIPIVFDPNVRLGVEPDVARWRARIADFVALADVVKASADDLEALGHPSLEDAVKGLFAGRAKLVIVTEGGQGARVFLRGDTVTVPAPPTTVVDTVGAGDTFLAGMLAGLAEQQRLSVAGLAALDRSDAQAIASFAAEVAAHTCARRGADPPTRSDLISR